MKIITTAQQTGDWFQARAGYCTGSHAADILGFLKQTKADAEAGIRRESQKRADYRTKLVSEILTGQPAMEGFKSPWMDWGNEQEGAARTKYSVESGNEVDESGFVMSDTVPRMGGSPDGFIGEDGLLEIKCPATQTYLEWAEAAIVPPEHEPQMSFYMAITGRKWCEFAAFDPRLPANARLWVKRLVRNEARIAEIEAGVIQFNAEVDSMIARLEKIFGKFVIPAQMAAKTLPKALDGMLTESDFAGLL